MEISGRTTWPQRAWYFHAPVPDLDVGSLHVLLCADKLQRDGMMAAGPEDLLRHLPVATPLAKEAVLVPYAPEYTKWKGYSLLKAPRRFTDFPKLDWRNLYRSVTGGPPHPSGADHSDRIQNMWWRAKARQVAQAVAEHERCRASADTSVRSVGGSGVAPTAGGARRLTIPGSTRRRGQPWATRTRSRKAHLRRSMSLRRHRPSTWTADSPTWVTRKCSGDRLP